ncbi:hypothetical protein CLOP_g8600 [Closterium sp. NIES-67]|nr:hypothetical protein CLOP_g8600 [Closterium sp. NIES-67]
MCTDYKALNRVTIKSRYPISRADELIDQLRKARFFSKIDLRGGYHQIRVAAGDYYKTAFCTRYGSFEYIFSSLVDKCVIVYLDDILIYSEVWEQHLKDLEAVFTLLQEHRLLTKGSKCESFKDRLEFLGHVISARGVKVDSHKIETVQAWLPPKNLQELQIFLRFVNYVRRFIPSMVRVTVLLADLMWKGTEYRWGRKSKVPSLCSKLLCAQPLSFASPILTAHSKSLLRKDRTDRILVPEYSLLQKLLLHEAHECTVSGHLVVEKTPQQLTRYYSWADMEGDVQRHVVSCRTCQTMKSSEQPAGQLQPIPPPERAWQQVAMDFIMGLPVKDGCNDAIFVIVDKLTKMAHFAACKKVSQPKKRPALSSQPWFASTEFHPLAFRIVTQNSAISFGATSGNNLARVCNSPPPTTRDRRTHRTGQSDIGICRNITECRGTSSRSH